MTDNKVTQEIIIENIVNEINKEPHNLKSVINSYLICYLTYGIFC